MITSAFTCTGPYAILIMLGIKRVENRSMCPSPVKGRCAVSCSKSFCKEEFGNFVQWASRALPAEQFAMIPAWSDVADWPGKIVGCVDYSCREGGETELWNEGCRYWWDLSEVVSFDRLIACRGNTGMWDLSQTLVDRVTVADGLARTVGTEVATAEDAVRIFEMAVPIAGKNEGLFVLPIDLEQRTLSEPILVSLGEPTTTSIQQDEVFAAALKLEAKSIVLAHNHPSGDLTPSEDDIKLTRALLRAAEVMAVPLKDHIVIGDVNRPDGKRYVSIRESGLVEFEG